jgi:hypothetical protein
VGHSWAIRVRRRKESIRNRRSRPERRRGLVAPSRSSQVSTDALSGRRPAVRALRCRVWRLLAKATESVARVVAGRERPLHRCPTDLSAITRTCRSR